MLEARERHHGSSGPELRLTRLRPAAFAAYSAVSAAAISSSPGPFVGHCELHASLSLYTPSAQRVILRAFDSSGLLLFHDRPAGVA